ncbi:sulfotransferase family protein [Celeribacter litoreus]|uniref:sulfotransferase family protein n=1 Tax=Celeribacter litoreus TaxID=2876714 RepID=UPI001CCBFC9E|nr:sulfotransferase [Celeribacter litoreus]MCA0045257.1 sulfotransferase [Celeribacter litoreus]
MDATLDNNVTYCFGIGAQKAGTTWLASYLRKHPDVHVPAVKELHYFDAHFDPKVRRAYNLRTAKLSEVKSAGEAERLQALLDMIDAPGEDHAVYRRLMTTGRGNAKIVADITPSYALLSEDNLAQINRDFPNSKFIYIMRDPIDRTRSQLKMLYKKRPAEQSEQSYVDFVDGFVNGDAHQGIVARTRYAQVLKKFEAAIPEEQRLVLFYEELFSDEGVGKICDFLGIPFMRGDYGTRVHGGLTPRADEADARLVEALAGRLAPIYTQMDKRYGDALPETWKAALNTVQQSKRRKASLLSQQER